MVKYVLAAVIGLVAGGLIIFVPAEQKVAAATAIIVMSIFFAESATMCKLEGKK
ncbi:MAG: hypothetical protein V1744_06970 [Candidatus Altiarchaeota archaeon]